MSMMVREVKVGDDVGDGGGKSSKSWGFVGGGSG